MRLVDEAVRGALAREDARTLMRSLLQGELSEAEMRELLLGINARGFDAAELAGFAEAMRAASVVLPFSGEEREQLVDTCGTGGDASGSFNISTAVALTAAACGVKIAKHGNRSVTSKCGSADVLEVLGIPVGMNAEDAAAAIRKDGFAFLLAPVMHPAMKVVAPVRKAIGVRTVFNVLGPMTNPAGAAGQVMGVYSAELVPLVAEALAMLRLRHAMVVHGDGGLDELSLSGPSDVAVVRECGWERMTITPEDAGLSRAPMSALAGGDAAENAAILRAIFAGEERGPKRDVVLLNTAAVLLVAGLVDDLRGGVARASSALESNAVTELVERLANVDALRRKVHRMFSKADADEALQLLLTECAGTLPMVRNVSGSGFIRIQAAVLKLSGGNLNELRRRIGQAKSDWRDVLLATEFGRDLEAHKVWLSE